MGGSSSAGGGQQSHEWEENRGEVAGAFLKRRNPNREEFSRTKGASSLCPTGVLVKQKMFLSRKKWVEKGDRDKHLSSSAWLRSPSKAARGKESATSRAVGPTCAEPCTWRLCRVCSTTTGSRPSASGSSIEARKRKLLWSRRLGNCWPFWIPCWRIRPRGNRIIHPLPLDIPDCCWPTNTIFELPRSPSVLHPHRMGILC